MVTMANFWNEMRGDTRMTAARRLVAILQGGDAALNQLEGAIKGGDFARLMSSRDKKNARATLEAQQYLDGVYRACAAPTAAPPAFLADVFAESPRKKRRQA